MPGASTATCSPRFPVRDSNASHRSDEEPATRLRAPGPVVIR
jgi:hypothetical protein